MTNNELPGNKTPYKIEAGQGLRYAFGSHLACMVADGALEIAISRPTSLDLSRSADSRS